MREDYLNRDIILQDLIKVVEAMAKRKKGVVFAIDGAWGRGKSFLLDMLTEHVRVQQDEENGDDKYFVIRYDCWKNDFYSEPIVSILATVHEDIEKELSWVSELKDDSVILGAISNLKRYVERCAGKVIEKHLGVDPIATYNECKEEGEQLIQDAHKEDTYYNLKEVLNSVHGDLEEISKYKTVIFLVDELERCMPEYTVRVLERLHHIFSEVPNFITILAVDKEALKEVIRQAYGLKTDVDAYLKKIVDFYFSLDVGKPKENYLKKYEEYATKFVGTTEEFVWCENIVLKAMEKLNVREHEKIFSNAQVAHDVITDEKIDVSCMAFELLSMRFSEVEDMKKFLEADPSVMKDISYPRIKGKEYLRLKEHVGGKVLWYVLNILYVAENGCCNNYTICEYEKYIDIVEKMRLFMDMRKRIK